ncbi:HAD-like protein [Macrolepiota fuliginosa MF-IS2]|uniref:HAD-like protein n=1 Tax=Macrolepiota fuliginosa MF-IS2 TaxID=1400762 RepID=A0A9P6C4M2_9AGAR|nr:HAD-like protein [Macrolepiota fuliginosa MF-IS2]
MPTQAQTQAQSETQGHKSLKNIDAFIFDVFGTVVDWRTSVVRELQELGKKHGFDPQSVNWGKFAQEWRMGYMQNTRRLATEGSASDSFNVDVMHRQLLDELLTKPEWSAYGSLWTEEEKRQLNLVWHRLDGWPDTVPWLNELKKDKIIVTLSNGNMRLLIDMAKYANLPWDTIFSTELFDTFKPNPRPYLSVARHLSLPPERCAMVATHIFDLRAAGSLGLTTIYVPRPDEDVDLQDGEIVKTKADGGEVDIVVDSFEGIVRLVRGLD